MKPSQIVVEKFGGVLETSKLLKIGLGTASRWKHSKTGWIPAKYQRRILTTAKKRGVKIKPEELVDW